MGASLTVGASAQLDTAESIALQQHEQVIERGLQTFYEVGTALAAIRDGRLYRQSHSTFEDYCRERWGISRPSAYRLMDAAQVHENLSPIGDILPATESQARPLAVLQPQQQREAWQRAVEVSNGKPTAAVVQRVVAEYRAPERPSVLSEPPRESAAPKPMAVHYSSATPEWYTPRHIVGRVLDMFQVIDLDPCSNTDDMETANVPALNYYTKETNGLAHQWHGYVYMNPPYGDEVAAWVEKLLSEYRAGRTVLALALLPARPDTAWFQPLFDFPLCFLRGRLKFSGSENSAPFPSVVVYLGDDPASFVDSFADLGRIVACVDKS